MKLEERRKVRIEASHEELCARAITWATKSGFAVEALTDDLIVFTRGSSWRSVYTLDIQKLPTKVSIRLSAETPIEVDCRFAVESVLPSSTAGDAERLSEELNLLIAYLNEPSR